MQNLVERIENSELSKLSPVFVFKLLGAQSER